MIFVLTDLGYGDCSKGATCHYLVNKYGAHTVVRTGGPQAFHTVVTCEGKEHTFSQFGAGSLLGTSTYLSKNMIIDPYAVFNEGMYLKKELGIEDIFDKLTIDQECLVISPFQAHANKLREMARGDGRYGSVGIGVGETVCDSEKLGEGAIRVKDIGRSGLREKLEIIRRLKLNELSEIFKIPNLPDYAHELIKDLNNPEIVDEIEELFLTIIGSLRVVDSSYLGVLLRMKGNVVFEPSQGVLLDRWYGFHPYTTLANPKQESAMELIKDQDYKGDILRIGIMRGYQTRHGAGPFVTEDGDMLLEDVHNREHPWQGRFRVGHLDLVATRYAIEVTGGPQEFDGLAVSCLDRLPKTSKICDSYIYSDGEKDDVDNFFDIDGGIAKAIKVQKGPLNQDFLNHQARLGQMLKNCRPVYETVETLNLLDEIEKRLEVPIMLAAYGPTEKDRKEVSGLVSRVA